MRGKTTLLNAIKWCLYGEVTTQVARKKLQDEGFANYDARDEGVEFSVGSELVVEHGNDVYTLSRHFLCQQNVAAPDEVVISKPAKLHVVGQQSGALNQHEAREVITSMLPDDLSGLFFFDGESLGELQSSLSTQSGAAILRNRIERILGMPAYTESIDVVAQLRKELSKKITEKNRALKRHEEEATQLREAQEKLEDQVRQRDEVLEFVEKARRTRRDLEPRFRANALLFENQRRYEEARAELADVEGRVADLRVEIKETLQRYFWLPLVSNIGELQRTLETRIQEGQATIAASRPPFTEQRLQGMLTTGTCDVCGHALGEEEVAHLKRSVVGSDVASDLSLETQESIAKLQEARKFVNGEAYALRLEDLDADLRRERLEADHKQRRVQDLRQLLEESGDEESTIGADYANAMLDEEQGEKTFRDLSDDVDRLKAAIRQIESSMSDLSDDPELKVRGRALTTIEDLLVHGLESFASMVRKDVESEASAVFRRLTTEPMYSGLRIDNDYNLAIVDDTDRVIKKRSAGAEQIVAMSLIGALTHCAVADSPVLIDSPFGRLDLRHRENVIRWLPDLAEQVVLFVTSGEFDADLYRPMLGNQIAAEYELVAESHVRTRIRSL
jgi:DNA sulfur modification protein DndD